MNNKTKYIVILGVDNEQKARAAKFGLNDEAAVRKAASSMGYLVGLTKSDDGIRVANALPDGKLFESGLSMIPLVRVETFYKLYELLGFDDNWTCHGIITGAKTSNDPSAIKSADELWGAIKVGSTVLLFDHTEPTLFGWSAAIVLSVSKDGEKLELRWRDWPNFKPFTAERRRVVLLRPDICC